MGGNGGNGGTATGLRQVIPLPAPGETGFLSDKRESGKAGNHKRCSMRFFVPPVMALCLAFPLAPPALADGDPAAGEKGFRRCKACHSVSNGEDVIVRGGRSGPDLYGVIGRPAGAVEGFRYSAALTAAGEAGLVWDADTLVAFVTDPRAFLRDYLDDSTARSTMTFRLRKGGEDIAAWLATFPANGGGDGDENRGAAE